MLFWTRYVPATGDSARARELGGRRRVAARFGRKHASGKRAVEQDAEPTNPAKPEPGEERDGSDGHARECMLDRREYNLLSPPVDRSRIAVGRGLKNPGAG